MVVRMMLKRRREYKSEGDELMETADAKVLRSRLAHTETVKGHMLRFWGVLDMIKDSRGSLTRAAYVALNVKIQKALVSDFCKAEAMRDADTDWDSDMDKHGGGLPHDGGMPYGVFAASMFELADLWCEGICEREYGKFLDGLTTALVKDKGAELLQFKDDADISFAMFGHNMMAPDGGEGGAPPPLLVSVGGGQSGGDDDEVDELPPMPVARRRQRRSTIKGNVSLNLGRGAGGGAPGGTAEAAGAVGGGGGATGATGQSERAAMAGAFLEARGLAEQQAAAEVAAVAAAAEVTAAEEQEAVAAQAVAAAAATENVGAEAAAVAAEQRQHELQSALPRRRSSAGAAPTLPVAVVAPPRFRESSDIGAIHPIYRYREDRQHGSPRQRGSPTARGGTPTARGGQACSPVGGGGGGGVGGRGGGDGVLPPLMRRQASAPAMMRAGRSRINSPASSPKSAIFPVLKD
jgi:hypothetical protein